MLKILYDYAFTKNPAAPFSWVLHDLYNGAIRNDSLDIFKYLMKKD
jgi:hypothetical protein